MKPYLDKQLKKVQSCDLVIKKYEENKKNELAKMGELLDLAVVSTHSLANGYTVKPANKMKMHVKDIGEFMKWLKNNKTPSVVFEFFKDAMKITALKKFCENEFNDQRVDGNLEPKIDGIEFGELTYTRLTTYTKEKSNGCEKSKKSN